MRRYPLWIVALTSMSVLSRAAEPPSRSQQRPKSPSPAQVSTVTADNQFSIDLYLQLVESNEGNLFCSGHSVLACFLMAAAGAEGETADQIGETLRLPGSYHTDAVQRPWNFTGFAQEVGRLQQQVQPPSGPEVTQKKRQLAKLQAQLKKLQTTAQASNSFDFEDFKSQQKLVEEINTLSQQVDPYELNFANAVWVDDQFPLREDYLTAVSQDSDAAVFPSAFRLQPDKERVRINDWVGSQTNDKIQNLLAPGTVDSLTRLILTNAVYFKGNWMEPFSADRTKEEPFTLDSGETKPTLLMHSNQHCSYVELRPDGSMNDYVKVDAPDNKPFGYRWKLPVNADGVKLLALPYRGGEMSMLFILPNRHDGLNSIEEQLTASRLGNWQKSMKGHDVDISIPRFKMRNTFNLNNTLASLGMNAPFLPGGFSGLSSSPEARDLFIGLVVQQAFVEVNEEGTEAAAATAIAFPTSAAPELPKPDPVFRAGHPFLFAIQHNSTGAILFLGRFTAPPE